MLSKLLKYDLKWVYKLVAIFYTLAFIFSIIGRVLGEIENSLVFDIVSKISFGFAISMMVSSLINCLMRLWARFVRNVYKDESYLTHTLPVKKENIFASKVISGIICVFTTMIVIIVCLFICYYSKANMEVLKNILELAATTYNTTVLKLLLLVAVVIFLEIIYVLLIGYVGIILGHKSNKNKMLRSIVIGFVLYFVFQALTLGLIAIYGLFNPEVMNLINTTDIVNIEAIKSVMYAGIGIYVVYSIIFYWLGKRYLNRGVNVE
jgi:hypothetical protein